MPESIASAYLAFGTSAITYPEFIKELEQGLVRAKKHYKEEIVCEELEKKAIKTIRKAWIELWEKSITKAKEAHKKANGNVIQLRADALYFASKLLAIYQASDDLKEKILKNHDLVKPDMIIDSEMRDIKNNKINNNK